ncbi:hypothetical protein MD484_g9050, partial [Candolleomyces efflorescens]
MSEDLFFMPKTALSSSGLSSDEGGSESTIGGHIFVDETPTVLRRGTAYHAGRNSSEEQARLDPNDIELQLVRRADADKLMASGNSVYRAQNDKCQALKACVEKGAQRIRELEKELKGYKKAEKKQKSLESKMSAVLDAVQNVVADLKVTSAELKLAGLGAPGSGGTAHWTDRLAKLKLPTRPVDEDEARELFWDEDHVDNNGDSGVSTPLLADGNLGRRTAKVPIWAVDYINGQVQQVGVKEWERARRSARSQLAAVLNQRPNSVVRRWLKNDADIRGEIKAGIISDIPWIALAAGDHKLDKLMGPIFSEHFTNRSRSQLSVVKRENSNEAADTHPAKKMKVEQPAAVASLPTPSDVLTGNVPHSSFLPELTQP